jgi:hypothetical protein
MGDESYYGRTVEAAAIHAVVDGDDATLDRVLRGLLPYERRQLARQARILADACDEIDGQLG